MKKNVKFLFLLVAILIIISLVSCNKSKKTNSETNSITNSGVTQDKTTRQNIEKGNVSIEEVVKEKMHALLDVSFGENIEEVKIENVTMFSSEDISGDEGIASLNLHENEYPFEVKFSVKVKEGVNEGLFENMTGKLEDGWIKDNVNCGVLRPSGDNDYKITNYGSNF